MIDVHIGLMPHEKFTPPPSCKGINFHIVHSVAGHIGKTRRKGFERGDSEFCAFVDPDDECFYLQVIELAETLKTAPQAGAIISRELVHGHVRPHRRLPKDGEPYTLKQIIGAHHIAIYRRAVLEKYFNDLDKFNNKAEFCLNGIMLKQGETLLHSSRYAYNWRPTKTGARLMIKPNRATQECLKSLLKTISAQTKAGS